MILSSHWNRFKRSFGMDALIDGSEESRASGLTDGRPYGADAFPFHWFIAGCCMAFWLVPNVTRGTLKDDQVVRER